MSVAPEAGVVPSWTLGDRIRKARELASLSQEQLGELVGVSRASIVNYEHGHTQPPQRRTRLIAMACGVDADWLLTGCAVRDSNPEPAGSMPHPAATAAHHRGRPQPFSRIGAVTLVAA
jgi:transcriptional regulator with XRE-family HTH domain